MKKNEKIIALLAARDVGALAVMLDKKQLNVSWKDAAGKTLLHFAAAFGDTDFAQKLLEKGAKTLTPSDDGALPIDTAQAWGHTAIVDMLKTQMAAESRTLPFPYTSLDDIRQESARTGVSQFCRLAAQCLFDKVAALAEKDPEGFRVSDLMEKGENGETVIFRLCQRDGLKILLNSALFKGGAGIFTSAIEGLPREFLKQADVGGFLASFRQMSLKSRAKPKFGL